MNKERLGHDFVRALPELEAEHLEEVAFNEEPLYYVTVGGVLRRAIEAAVEAGDRAFISRAFEFTERMLELGDDQTRSLARVEVLEGLEEDLGPKYSDLLGPKSLAFLKEYAEFIEASTYPDEEKDQQVGGSRLATTRSA